jgi:hypothetical protein
VLFIGERVLNVSPTGLSDGMVIHGVAGPAAGTNTTIRDASSLNLTADRFAPGEYSVPATAFGDGNNQTAELAIKKAAVLSVTPIQNDTTVAGQRLEWGNDIEVKAVFNFDQIGPARLTVRNDTGADITSRVANDKWANRSGEKLPLNLTQPMLRSGQYTISVRGVSGLLPNQATNLSYAAANTTVRLGKTTLELSRRSVRQGDRVRARLTGPPTGYTTLWVEESTITGTERRQEIAQQLFTGQTIEQVHVSPEKIGVSVDHADITAAVTIDTGVLRGRSEIGIGPGNESRPDGLPITPRLKRPIEVQPITPPNASYTVRGNTDRFEAIRVYVQRGNRWVTAYDSDGDRLRRVRGDNYEIAVGTGRVFNQSGTHQLAVVGYDDDDRYRIGGAEVRGYAPAADVISKEEFEQFRVVERVSILMQPPRITATLSRQRYAVRSGDPLRMTGSYFGHGNGLLLYLIEADGQVYGRRLCVSTADGKCPSSDQYELPYTVDLSRLSRFPRGGTYHAVLVGRGSDGVYSGPTTPRTFADELSIIGISGDAALDRLKSAYGTGDAVRTREITAGAAGLTITAPEGDTIVSNTTLRIAGKSAKAEGTTITITLRRARDSRMGPALEQWQTTVANRQWEQRVEIPQYRRGEYILRVTDGVTEESKRLQLRDTPTVPPIRGEKSPQTVDGDPQLEDIDGNGKLDIFDVQQLFVNLESTVVQSHANAFDFDHDDSDTVDIFDVQALFKSLD